MRPGDIGIGRVLSGALLTAVLTPILTGILVAVRDPFADMDTRALIGLWVEFEVLVLVAAAVIAGYVRAGAERRRRAAIGELRRRAVRDPLTALLNRRGLVSMMSRKNWSKASGRSALLIDIDNFKQINDSYGHITGDRVLIAVADTLFDLVGEGWLVARLGGDEFLLIRRGAELDRAEADAIVARIPQALKRLGLPVVTAGYGRVSDPTGSLPLDELVIEADRDLAYAKGVEPRSGERIATWFEDGSSELLARGHELFRAYRQRRSDRIREAVKLRRVGTVCAATTLVLCSLAMLAVPLDLHWLRTAEPDSALSFTSSLTFAFAGLMMLYYYSAPHPGPRRIRRLRMGGMLVALIGALAIIEHLSGRTLIPTELISDPLEGTVSNITRPDWETGLGLFLGGLYTMLIRQGGRLAAIFKTVVAVALVAIVAGAAFGVLLGAGYLWQGSAPAISPQGMMAGATLAVALLVAEPRLPLLRLFLSGGGAAQISKTLVIAGVSVPLVSGVILAHLDLAQGPGWKATVMIVALLQATILATLAVITVRVVEHADKETAVIWRKLSEIADRDPLTGLFTRDRFDREIEICCRKLAHGGHPFSVVLLDLDRLKSLNTTLGYAAGDKALRDVAFALQTGVRPSDLPVRLGGDEFAILLPKTDQAEAERVARRCAARIEQTEIGDEVLRVSWGVASADADTDTRELLEIADRRLYAAKEKGRDPVPDLNA